MLHLACLQLALNDGNSNMIQLKSLQSTVCILLAVCTSLHFTLSLYFTPGPSLQFAVCRLQSTVVCSLQSAVHSLHFTLTVLNPSPPLKNPGSTPEGCELEHV